MEILSTRSSEHGSVVFARVRSREGTVSDVVIKGSTEPARELFCQLLAERLGVRAPEIRVAHYPTAEWADFKAALGSYDANMEYGRRHRAVNRPQFLLQDEVRAAPIWQFTPELAARLWTTDTAPGRVLLADVARIMAMDVVLNYQDRFPLLRSNDGNYSNVLFDTETGAVVAVDNGHFAIAPLVSGRDNPQHARYMASVRSLMRALRGSGTEAPHVQDLRDKLLQCTGVRLDEQAGLFLQRCLLEAFASLCEKVTPELLESLKEQVRETVPQDWEDVWVSDVRRIDTRFVSDVIKVIQEEEQGQEEEES